MTTLRGLATVLTHGILAMGLGLGGATAQDLGWISIGANQDSVNGLPLPDPYYVNILLDAHPVNAVTLMPPPGSGLPTMDLVFDTDFHFLWVLDDSVDAWWDAQPVGDPFGDYTFDLAYVGGATDQVVISYNPTTPVAAPVILSPEHLANDVPVDTPLVTWIPGSGGGWFWVELDGPGGNSESGPNNGQSSWQHPGDLEAGASYQLTVGVQLAEPSQQLQTLGLDDFDFYPDVSASDDIWFTTTWQDEGCALAGVAGVPSLAGSGDLSEASSNSIDLTLAAPSAICGLLLGFGGVQAPFKGGVIKALPSIPGSPVILATDGGGSLALSFTWVTGAPPGTELWVQYAIQDAAAVKGVSLSNALRGVTP